MESWSDDELLDQYRYIRAELAQERPVSKESVDNPAEVLADEIHAADCLCLPTHRPQAPAAKRKTLLDACQTARSLGSVSVLASPSRPNTEKDPLPLDLDSYMA